MLEQALSGGAGATVSELNQRLGLTRKYAIPLLEYFDARGRDEAGGGRAGVGTVKALTPAASRRPSPRGLGEDGRAARPCRVRVGLDTDPKGGDDAMTDKNVRLTEMVSCAG